MQNPSLITLDEMRTENELFRSVYPDLIGEIERVEKARGKLNDFQLMMAVSYAKNGLGVLNYERRQIINAIFTAFTGIYRKEGRVAAGMWAKENFGCEAAADEASDNVDQELAARLEELSTLIRHKETELLKIYREYHMLQAYIEKVEEAPPTASGSVIE